MWFGWAGWMRTHNARLSVARVRLVGRQSTVDTSCIPIKIDTQATVARFAPYRERPLRLAPLSVVGQLHWQRVAHYSRISVWASHTWNSNICAFITPVLREWTQVGKKNPQFTGTPHKSIKRRVSRRNCRLSRDELSINIYIGCGNGAGFAMISFVFVAVV